jgi:hypothetical protein
LLIARVGAAFEVCPPTDPKALELGLSTIRLVNFSRYWRLPAPSFEEALAAIDAEQVKIIAAMRQRWSAGTCGDARNLGVKILENLAHKLKPFIHEDWQEPGRNERDGLGAMSLVALALEFESVVNPKVYEQLPQPAGGDRIN